MKPQKALNRPPTVLLLLFLALISSILILAIQSTFFSGAGKNGVNSKDISDLYAFQNKSSNVWQQRALDSLHTLLTTYNVQFKNYDPLEYPFDVCETILLWEQYRNMTTILTREYLDARPNGWLEYAAQRISQLPPFYPRQFRTCAVVGNSGDLLKTEFGLEIDAHNAVIRENEAPVNEGWLLNVDSYHVWGLLPSGTSVMGFLIQSALHLHLQAWREFTGTLAMLLLWPFLPRGNLGPAWTTSCPQNWDVYFSLH
ncbi:hypothetical protein AMTR_s00012p00184040 [Amborella trichopoda]|uniref:Uncharacterized protein n=1 Tax=Amborella trichopoda TaxID=13333 RepID=W1PJI7_AMBTC|nr:hypothetical protein AMTR_s00012p00184040 [Amborella trichopoda]